ncbi:hypothetical protein HanIR_Chr17g0846481 [Helianthus annuus]|nr:hypothetical protein HanIR_Chr17g0846481 [Helianthus annuus]
MGCICSTSSSTHHHQPSSSHTPSISPSDLTSYEHACRSDPDIQSFDSSLHYRTTRVINSPAVDAVPLGSMGKWVNSLWKKYENELKAQRETISSMRVGNRIVIKDLDNIKVLVDKLGNEMEELVRNAKFAIREEDEEAVAVDEMRKVRNDFVLVVGVRYK